VEMTVDVEHTAIKQATDRLLSSKSSLASVDALPFPVGHIPALDAVRGAAILLVMGFHFTMMTANNNPLSAALCKVAMLGVCGVDVFFVLSGFLITGLLFDAKGSDGFFRTFYARRILRIFPLYYVALTLMLGLLPLAAGLRVSGFDDAVHNQGWLWLHASNVGLIVQGPNSLGGLGHFWSLAVEEQFYLIWPAVIFFFKRETLLKICGCIAVAALVLRCILMFNGDHADACYLLTPCRIDQLAIGGWAALAARGPDGLRPLLRPARWLSMISLALLLALLGVRGHFRDGTHDDKLSATIGFSIVAVGVASVIIMVVALPTGSMLGRAAAAPPLRFFGKYSYALYVFHLFVFERLIPEDAITKAMSSRSFALSYLSLGAISLLTSLAVAWLSWHLLEKRFLSLKRFFSYRRPASQEYSPYVASVATG
jgi:peptidoglycan/LPS O-acetylase OafA/YrhL